MRKLIVVLAAFAFTIAFVALLLGLARGTLLLQRPPSASGHASFDSMLRGVLRDSHRTVTLDRTDVVVGRSTVEVPVLGEMEAAGYQYAAHLRAAGTDARWVEVFARDASSGDVAFAVSDPTSDTITALTAFDRLSTREPLFPGPSEVDWTGDLDPEMEGTVVWPIDTFDAAAGDDYFFGLTIDLLRLPDGTFRLRDHEEE